MARESKPQKRSRGTIDALPSGSLRVRVHAGVDPVTGKRHDLLEIVPAGPDAAKQAEKVRTKLLAQVDEQRNARTKATVNQLLDRYFELLSVETNTRENYVALARNHIRPLLAARVRDRIDSAATPDAVTFRGHWTGGGRGLTEVGWANYCVTTRVGSEDVVHGNGAVLRVTEGRRPAGRPAMW